MYDGSPESMLHVIIPCILLGGYNFYMKVAGGCTGVGEFDKISVRNFLTLDASTLPGKSEGDILYSIIYEMVKQLYKYQRFPHIHVKFSFTVGHLS